MISNSPCVLSLREQNTMSATFTQQNGSIPRLSTILSIWWPRHASMTQKEVPSGDHCQGYQHWNWLLWEEVVCMGLFPQTCAPFTAFVIQWNNTGNGQLEQSRNPSPILLPQLWISLQWTSSGKAVHATRNRQAGSWNVQCWKHCFQFARSKNIVTPYTLEAETQA